MKLRLNLLLASVLAALLSFGMLAPAQAAAPVTDLTASAVQTPGRHDSWTVTASWTPSDATTYRVVIADHSDGSVTPGMTYGGTVTSAATATIVTDTDKVQAEAPLWVAVYADDATVPITVPLTLPALDITAPTGSYVLNKTSTYISSGFFADENETADFRITQTRVDAGAVRTVDAGDGTPAKAWTSGSTFTLSYTKPGTYHPRVILTDEFDNSKPVNLPTVQVLTDTTAPVVHIKTPAKPGKARSWRVIRGTASDSGTGLALGGVFVMEKRGSLWWSYDFRKRKWLKGFTSRKKTEAKSKASPALFGISSTGTWRSPAIKGLTKGTLYVEAAAFDNEFNFGLATVQRKVR